MRAPLTSGLTYLFLGIGTARRAIDTRTAIGLPYARACAGIRARTGVGTHIGVRTDIDRTEIRTPARMVRFIITNTERAVVSRMIMPSPVIAHIVMMGTIMLVLGNLLADILLKLVDPRVSVS